LDKITNAGNAERALAGSHEGRETLELLQNARDAINDGDPSIGQVYVGVFETGVLVANTGEPFDLLDDETMNAVRKVGESKKSGESIGHKGVGLNSVLSVGDAFEVWSRVAGLDAPLRVRYSRAYLTAALAQRFGHDVHIDDLYRDLHPETFEKSSEEARGVSARGDGGEKTALPDAVGMLPLFWYPWPLRPDADGSPVATRAYKLLTDSQGGLADFDEPPTAPFRTAVFIEYEDEEWRGLLDELGVAAPDDEEETIDASEQAELLWAYLSNAVDRSTSLRPETLVQLGEIEHLYLERVDDSGVTVETEHWSVTREEEPIPAEDVRYEQVKTRIARQQGKDTERLFDQFWRVDCPETQPSLLVDRPDEAERVNAVSESPRLFRSEYPLYLFYPINRTDRHSLPFCLHGRFKVSTDRQDLSQSAKGHNRSVLEDGIRLVEQVAESMAELSEGDAGRWSVYPWVLLPPVTDRSPAEPVSTVELMEWLCEELYERLEGVACFPGQDGGRHTPAETTIHPDKTVVSGFAAAKELSKVAPTPHVESTIPPLPHLRTFERVLDSRQLWERRLERLIIGDGEKPTFTERILDEWTGYLSNQLAGGSDDDVALDVDKSSAFDLFDGTVELIRERADQVGGSEEVLEEYATTFDGVYLLPCEQAETETDAWLVQIEYRENPGASESTRTVVWGRAEELRSGDFPPKHGRFDVYFLEEAIQEPAQGILSNAGNYWGLRQSDGFAELYRSLLGTFGRGRREVIDTGSMGALATLIPGVDESRATSLQTGETHYFPAEYSKGAPVPSKRERRRQLNTRLRLRDATLDALNGTQIADLALPTAWQRERALARYEDENAGEETEPEEVEGWADSADLPAPSLPEPSDPVWSDVPVAGEPTERRQRLSRLLSLLGVSSLPGIRILWMYGPDHPSIKKSSQPHWNPLEWKPSTDRRRELRSVLGSNEEYLSWLISVSNHPVQSGSHAYSCDKTPVLKDGGVGSNLVGWVWFDAAQVERLTSNPVALIGTLGRHGKQYEKTILTTHWFCKSYQTCNPSHGLPTLANWQLRQFPVWGSVLNVRSPVEDQWGEDGERLAWAVLEGGKTGSQGWRLFPAINPEETSLSESLLDTLGVAGLDDLSVSQAEYRLQKLQSVLAADFSETALSSLAIPTERRKDWGNAYSQLLRPVMRYVRQEEISDIEELQEEFTYLTHIPLRRIYEEGDEWVSAPLSWLADNADDVRRYPQESPTPWEQKRVRDNRWELLDFPQIQAGFSAFAGALGVETVDAEKPVPSISDDDFELLNTRRERIDLSSSRQQLRRRQTLILASIGVTDDERLVEEAEKLDEAVENLAVTESMPKRVVDQLSDPRSGLYRTEDGEIGLVYNREKAERLEEDELAMGLALLFEQYRNVSVFETALDPEQSRDALEERWRKETFPIQAVRTAMEDHARQNIRNKLGAGRALLECITGIGDEVPTPAALMEEFDEGDEWEEETRTLVRISRVVRGESSEGRLDAPELSKYVEACRSSEPWVQTLLGKLFDGTPKRAWRDVLEDDVPTEYKESVIEWLLRYESLIDEPLVEHEYPPTAERLLAVYQTWGTTSEVADRLGSPEAWRGEVRHRYRQVEIDLSKTLPIRLRSIVGVADEQRWVSYSDVEELMEEVVDPFLDWLESGEGESIDHEIREMLATYIISADFGLESESGGRQNHKDRAYAAAEDAILSGRDADFSEFEAEDVWDITEGPDDSAGGVVTGSGGSGGGGSTQLRGRGEQAEVAVTLNLVQSLRDWLGAADDRQSEFTETMRSLYDEQNEETYRWHTETQWEDTLLPLLDSPSSTVREQFTDYPRFLNEGLHLDDLAPVKLLDVSGESGPGFDVIDPFGTISEREGEPPEWTLKPTPVEIKAVSGESAPFDFRFTTNEFRQAKRFTKKGEDEGEDESDGRYVIRFVDVPDPDTEDWLPHTRCVGERVFTDPDELDQMIRGHPFEEAVKGGYLNLSLGSNRSGGR
jgi:hypothetical protein